MGPGLSYVRQVFVQRAGGGRGNRAVQYVAGRGSALFCSSGFSDSDTRSPKVRWLLPAGSAHSLSHFFDFAHALRHVRALVPTQSYLYLALPRPAYVEFFGILRLAGNGLTPEQQRKKVR